VGDGPGPGWMDFAGMGIVAGLCVAAGVGGGYWLSSAQRSGPVPVFVGLALGLAAATAYAVYKIRSYLH
jgi:hypothetical protein